MRNPFVQYILHNQVLVGIFAVALIWFVIEIKNILVVLFISYILMAALSPFVTLLRNRKIPTILSVIIPYFTTLALFILLIFPLVPFLIAQVQQLFIRFPFYVDQAASVVGVEFSTAQLNTLMAQEADAIGKNALSLTGKVFGGFFSILTMLVITFYFLIDKHRIRESVVSLFPKTSQGAVSITLSHIEEKLGAWLRGQIVLSFSIGFLTWIVLTMLGLEFALPLAVIAGMLEIIPTIGPIVSAIPAVLVALSISPTMTAVVIAVYIVIQALENNILVPKIMEKAVGLNPVIIIIGVILGNQLMGVIGALLSIPFISMLVILLRALTTPPK